MQLDHTQFPIPEKCHIPENHKPGGKLFGLPPRTKGFKGATFMTTVRWDMFERIKQSLPDANIHITYGAATKLARENLKIKKSHANDAYSMGHLHPKHRAHFEHYKKRRRNNRILEKFYDAVYIDRRDGSKKKGSEIGSNRTKRSYPRRNQLNERMFRQQKISKGKRSIRHNRYEIRPGGTVTYQGNRYIVHGTQSNGKAVSLCTVKTVSATDIQVPKDPGGKNKPLCIGNRYALENRKEKHKLLTVSGNNAVMEWFIGVKPECVTVVSNKQNGWIPV